MASGATGTNSSTSNRSNEGGFVPAILGGGRKRKTEGNLEANKRRRMDDEVQDQSLTQKRVPLAAISTSRQNVVLSPRSPNTGSLKKSPLAKENICFSSSPSSPPSKTLRMRSSWSEFRQFINQSVEDSDYETRKHKSPFPVLSWADKNDLWKLMCKKESGVYRRQHGEVILNRHPSFRPRMRAILLDWLIEVCEVYRLHRETFYLAVDFIDRYLSITQDMPKNKLQLIGVSCLFIGAKIEEIYPPKLKEFAYVTDGACTEEQILEMELVILKALNWSLCPVTPNAWMKLFLQLKTVTKHLETKTLSIPNFPVFLFPVLCN
nr:G1/S-specific cyclin-E-like [Lepeophtheirus salmonis]XP_040582522.1 G1/S-specific cyclin-E-like [Lepeophtheirus salmonis]